MDNNKRYDVALSFAGEQRGYVEEVARELMSMDITTFYDKVEEEIVRLWGGYLPEDFHDVYENMALYVVMFISREYVDKAWTTHERRSALSGAIQGKTRILPVRFDNTLVPGLPTGISYLQASDYKSAELAVMVAKKLGREFLPEFNIHEVENVSFLNARRLVYRIEVPDAYSETQGRMIAEHIVNTKHRTGTPVNALGFLFYFPVANPNQRADGSIDWAPNGVWGDADTVQTGDYRNFRFETQFWNKRSLPILYHGTRVRMDIFRKIAQAEARGRIESEEEGGPIQRRIGLQRELTEVYKNDLSETYSLSEAELKKIMVEGVKNNWPME